MEYETSFIKCYPRPEKDGKIPGYQRRILLKGDGALKGCPDNDDPIQVAIIHAKDFHKFQNIDLDKIDDMELEVKATLNQLTTLQLKYEKTLEDLSRATGIIGLQQVAITKYDKYSFLERLRGKKPKELESIDIGEIQVNTSASTEEY